MTDSIRAIRIYFTRKGRGGEKEVGGAYRWETCFSLPVTVRAVFHDKNISKNVVSRVDIGTGTRIEVDGSGI